MNIRKEAAKRLVDFLMEEQRKAQRELETQKHILQSYISKRAELKMKISGYGKMIGDLLGKHGGNSK